MPLITDRSVDNLSKFPSVLSVVPVIDTHTALCAIMVNAMGAYGAICSRAQVQSAIHTNAAQIVVRSNGYIPCRDGNKCPQRSNSSVVLDNSLISNNRFISMYNANMQRMGEFRYMMGNPLEFNTALFDYSVGITTMTKFTQSATKCNTVNYIYRNLLLMTEMLITKRKPAMPINHTEMLNTIYLLIMLAQVHGPQPITCLINNVWRACEIGVFGAIKPIIHSFCSAVYDQTSEAWLTTMNSFFAVVHNGLLADKYKLFSISYNRQLFMDLDNGIYIIPSPLLAAAIYKLIGTQTYNLSIVGGRSSHTNLPRF